MLTAYTSLLRLAELPLALALILSTSGCSMAVSAPLEPASGERVKVKDLQSRIAFGEYSAKSRLGADVPKHTAGQDYGPYELAGYTNYFTFQMQAPDGLYTASCATSLREHEAQTPVGGFTAHETFKMHCGFGPDGAPPSWTLEFDGTGGLFQASSYHGALTHADQRFALRVPEYFGVLPMGVEILGDQGAIGAVRVEPNFPGYKPRVWLGADLPQALESVVAVSLVAIIYGSRTQHPRQKPTADEGERHEHCTKLPHHLLFGSCRVQALPPDSPVQLTFGIGGR